MIYKYLFTCLGMDYPEQKADVIGEQRPAQIQLTPASADHGGVGLPAGR